ncbi:ribose-phosphate pyrophosphokinase [candidate division WOR-1 bacterium RIFOXYA12_FULL_52_29]|uniref:Ribose-phosphate pyrophosphokinase n=1 Tax=candidate division WOR-1 bacterium RIFOXYC12_FULL_54_18 TaxID=1802584 RepID=A0A1F4T8P4_UNCSA|nr:MAG: ribose-phosphate pyrophosphokinase [candidate division WOR-1 bacterium RIFOXYA2_FULL_51_19]OGC18482.1 MAG: ribose-phosphate pyrophosphokinase [candidate division WOR-1 bacterium RIFOXYA12_FULL_52_29]OGC27339.1 MAG: ribose-phosphate pyrophosphokinase [candidate division WOR-1 bacterium RIFOXYB2_FULL_45_9]OGC28899.1 MAG: ribose-phosphate pyrophosphokinase [candidate division WOR-1 bacterium RIFOXYC12_FULL_54_18]OGC30051.1 MAG: ribose-phosphate pyrophosphokinase [candidate division WOR-1 b
MQNSNLCVFSGSSHPSLGEEIVRYIGIKKGEIKLSRFGGGEIYARILDNIRGHSVVIIQTCTEKVNEDLMELFIVIDAMKRASAKSITAVIPHFGYARQDRKAASREPISARLVANLLETAGADRIVVMDLHSDQIQGFFNIPVDTLTALPLFANYLKDKNIQDPVVVAPDTGRAKVAKKLADRIGASLAILHKVRSGHHQSEVTHIVGEVKGKTVIITDDMIDTAGTVTSGVEVLRKEGCNKDIYLAATHGIFSGPALERINKTGFAEVIISDTLPVNKQIKNLKVLSTAELLGEAIKRNYENRSISSLFD